MVIGLSGVQFGLLQTELDDTKSYYQLIIKITISEKRKAKLWKKGKMCIKIPAIRRQKHKGKRAHARNYNFDYDWLIKLQLWM